jgi:hypothetical protein
MKVFLILAPIFVLVGIWLFVFSKRRSRLVRSVGEKRGLIYLQRDDGKLEGELNRSFVLPSPLGRNFSRIIDIVESKGIYLFRVTEALDLSSYGIPQNTHFGRISTFFKTGSNLEIFFLTNPECEIRLIVPKEGGTVFSNPKVVELKRIIDENPPPHSLSITVMRGRFLAYLEPVLAGSEKEADLDYLLEFAKHAKTIL